MVVLLGTRVPSGILHSVSAAYLRCFPSFILSFRDRNGLGRAVYETYLFT